MGWAWTEQAYALPVTVAGDLVLAQKPGVLAWVGPVCAYPAGFSFYLTIGLDRAHVADRLITFRGHGTAERATVTRLEVSFSDGRIADSAATFSNGRQVRPGDPVLRFSGGSSEVRDYHLVPRSESRWWVSPLPPPGPVVFRLFLQGSAESTGTAEMDAGLISEAASRSEILWPGVESGPW